MKDTASAGHGLTTARHFTFDPFLWGVGLVAILLAASGSSLIFGAESTLYFLAIAAGLVCAAFAVSRPIVLVVFVIFTSCTTGGLVSLEGVKIGSTAISFNGLVTALITLGASLSIILHWRQLPKYSFRAFLPFWLFGGFAVVRCFGSSAGPDAWRQAFLMVAPLFVGLLTSLVLTQRESNLRKIEIAFVYSAVLPIAAILISIPIGLLEFTPEGFISVLGRRSFALYMLVILAFSLAQWRYSITKEARRIGLWVSAASLAIILISLSRTSSAVAVAVLLPLRFFGVSRTNLLRLLSWPILAVACLVFLLQWGPARARFLGDASIPGKLDELSSEYESLNTSGRNLMWAATLASALESPLLGHGTGTASRLIEEVFPGLEHPHNDYLRVFHDQGIIGLFLFLLAWTGRIAHHWRKWKSSESGRPNILTRYQMAAMLVAVAVSLSFLTDNVAVYEHVLMPAFVVFSIADCLERQGNFLKADARSRGVGPAGQ